MIRFFNMFSSFGGFHTGLVHTLGLRQEAPRTASVGATEAKKEGTK